MSPPFCPPRPFCLPHALCTGTSFWLGQWWGSTFFWARNWDSQQRPWNAAVTSSFLCRFSFSLEHFPFALVSLGFLTGLSRCPRALPLSSPPSSGAHLPLELEPVPVLLCGPLHSCCPGVTFVIFLVWIPNFPVSCDFFSWFTSSC